MLTLNDDICVHPIWAYWNDVCVVSLPFRIWNMYLLSQTFWHDIYLYANVSIDWFEWITGELKIMRLLLMCGIRFGYGIINFSFDLQRGNWFYYEDFWIVVYLFITGIYGSTVGMTCDDILISQVSVLCISSNNSATIPPLFKNSPMKCKQCKEKYENIVFVMPLKTTPSGHRNRT